MAARTPVAPKRRGRGGLRILIALVVIVLLVVAGIVTLGIVASADTSVGAVLTTFVPNTAVARNGGSFGSNATTGTLVNPGDQVRTDKNGRAQIQFPDGSITRLSNCTKISVDASHFGRTGHVHDISITDKIGRTLTSVEHLVGGASFNVVGNTTTASVRGTLFEVLNNNDRTETGCPGPAAPKVQTNAVVIKLFRGSLLVSGKSGQVHLTEGQQVTVDPQGNIGQPGPIQPDPDDPFAQDVTAITDVTTDTTPGTEQDCIGAPLHNGDVESCTYSFAGGSALKAALAYPGSLMELRITDPTGHVTSKTGPSVIDLTLLNPPVGIYKLESVGISGLNPDGEEPFLTVAAQEPCQTTNVEQNGAVRHSYNASDLQNSVSVSGLSNLHVTVLGDTIGGAILTGTLTYNGIGLGGTLLVYPHGGNASVVPLAASAFGLNIPPQQAGQQVASALGQDPNNVSLGFDVERIFTCQNVLMIEGRSA